MIEALALMSKLLPAKLSMPHKSPQYPLLVDLPSANNQPQLCAKEFAVIASTKKSELRALGSDGFMLVTPGAVGVAFE